MNTYFDNGKFHVTLPLWLQNVVRTLAMAATAYVTCYKPANGWLIATITGTVLGVFGITVQTPPIAPPPAVFSDPIAPKAQMKAQMKA